MQEISTESIIFLAALSYSQDWGSLQLEWDNNFINIGSEFIVFDRTKFRAGITKNIAQESELIFKYSIGILDFTPLPNDLIELFNSRLEEEEKVATVDTSIGMEHLQDGVDFYYKGQYRQAQKSYEIASEFFPHSAIIYERLGSIHYQLGNYREALYNWRKANNITPSDRLETFIEEIKQKIKK